MVSTDFFFSQSFQLRKMQTRDEDNTQTDADNDFAPSSSPTDFIRSHIIKSVVVNY